MQPQRFLSADRSHMSVAPILREVGPRDGLQNEASILPASTRAELCSRLAAAGLPRVEAASFVDPRLVPQMGGAEEVVAGLLDSPGIVWSGLMLNQRGYDRAVAAGIEDVNYVLPMTDGFAQHNQNTNVAGALEIAFHLVRRARADGTRMAVTLSVAFGCPFEGPISPSQVLGLAERLMSEPPDEIIVADTIGVGVPTQVRELVRGLAELGLPCGGHFHNTRNTGYVNALAALEAGATILDASVGGTGGCPFAPRATGNIATEDLVYLLHGMGIQTGIDLDALIEVSQWLGDRLGRDLPGQLARAGRFPPPHYRGNEAVPRDR